MEIAAQTIQTDLPCAACAYNLRGLDELGKCPECGISVRASMMPGRQGLKDARWLATLFRAAMLGAIIYPLMIALAMAPPSMFTRGTAQRAVALATTCLIWTLSWFATWMLTVRPSQRRDDNVARLAFRWSATLYLATPVIGLLIRQFNEHWLSTIMLVAWVLSGVVSASEWFGYSARLLKTCDGILAMTAFITARVMQGMSVLLFIVSLLPSKAQGDSLSAMMALHLSQYGSVRGSVLGASAVLAACGFAVAVCMIVVFHRERVRANIIEEANARKTAASSAP